MSENINWLDKFNRYFPIIAMLGGPAAILGMVWVAGQWYNGIDSKSFDSPEQKVYVVKTVEDMDSPAQQREKAILDSLDMLERKEFRKFVVKKLKEDSIIKNKTDCLYVRLNDQVYQMNQRIETIKQ